jgi:hypothetical protein
MKLFHKNYDDYHTVLSNIIEAKQQKSLIAAEYGKKDGVKVADFTPYTNHTIVRNHDEASEAITHLKVFLGEKNLPKPMVVQSTANVQTCHSLQRSCCQGLKTRTRQRRVRVSLASSRSY